MNMTASRFIESPDSESCILYPWCKTSPRISCYCYEPWTCSNLTGSSLVDSDAKSFVQLIDFFFLLSKKELGVRLHAKLTILNNGTYHFLHTLMYFWNCLPWGGLWFSLWKSCAIEAEHMIAKIQGSWNLLLVSNLSSVYVLASAASADVSRT